MEFALVILAVFAVLGWAMAIFLGKELLKKFGFMKKFISHQDTKKVTWDYLGKNSGLGIGMRNIVLRSEKPFCALIGFQLGQGYDYYGYVEASSTAGGYHAVISTYLGRGSARFMFLVNGDAPVTAAAETGMLQQVPHVTYPPHWWQRLGFFG